MIMKSWKQKPYISAKQSISGYVQDKPKYEFPEKWDKPQLWKIVMEHISKV